MVSSKHFVTGVYDGVLSCSARMSRLCDELSWIDCGQLIKNAMTNTLAQNERMVSITCIVIGMLIGYVLSWLPRLFSFYRESGEGGGGVLGQQWRNLVDDGKNRSNSNSNSNDTPKHIAVIMDGNRRFGKAKHGDPLKGHWAGGQTLLDFVGWAMEDGVRIVTVYAFSTENWSRDSTEVNLLMTMFGKYADTMAEEASKRNVQVKILSSDYNRLPLKVRAKIEALEAATASCDGLQLNVCLSYGARAEIAQACSSVVADVLSGKLEVPRVQLHRQGQKQSQQHEKVTRGAEEDKEREEELAKGGVEESKGGVDSGDDGSSKRKQNEHAPAAAASVVSTATATATATATSGELKPGSSVVVTEEMIAARLLTSGQPDPDLLIRTSGEVRVSNFLLYQLAYTEMFFVSKFWPEITQEDYRGVLRQFAERKRRFGS